MAVFGDDASGRRLLSDNFKVRLSRFQTRQDQDFGLRVSFRDRRGIILSLNVKIGRVNLHHQLACIEGNTRQLLACDRRHAVSWCHGRVSPERLCPRFGGRANPLGNIHRVERVPAGAMA